MIMIYIILFASGLIAGLLICYLCLRKAFEWDNRRIDRLKDYNEIFNRWLEISLTNQIEIINTNLLKKGYKRVAIYGMKDIGERLLETIAKSDELEINYVIDRRIADVRVIGEWKLVDNKEAFIDTDIIIVTPFYDFEAIRNELKNKTNGEIVSVEKLIFEV